METYCITPEKLKEIMNLVENGYRCIKFSTGDTMYIRLQKDEDAIEYEFVHC